MRHANPSPRWSISSATSPIVELKKFNADPCRLFVKLESQNPSGSIKDRIALSMIEAAERRAGSGAMAPSSRRPPATPVLGLAQVGLPRGYRLILVVPDKMSREKVQHLRALGADVRMTRSDVGKGHPEYLPGHGAAHCVGNAGRILRQPVCQSGQPAGARAHHRPGDLGAARHDVDAVVVGVGSGGTLSGLGRFFREVSPKTEIVLADPVGSVLTPFVETGVLIEAGSWAVEGHRRRLRAAPRRPVAGQARLLYLRSREPDDRPRTARP